MEEKRRHPRFPIMTTEQIIRLTENQTPRKNIIVTENISTSGMKFTINNPLKTTSYFLVNLNDINLDKTEHNKDIWLNSGGFYLTKVMWANSLKDDFYQVGARFLEKKKCNSTDLDYFTELVNIKMLDILPESIRYR